MIRSPRKTNGGSKAAKLDSSSSPLSRIVAYGESCYARLRTTLRKAWPATRDKFQTSLDELKAKLGNAHVGSQGQTLYATEATRITSAPTLGNSGDRRSIEY